MDVNNNSEQNRELSLIRELEINNKVISDENDSLKFINAKLGYAVKLMTEFHLTLDEKHYIADEIDSAEDYQSIKDIYDRVKKEHYNKSLDGMSEFQMSQEFKNNTRAYFAYSIGYDLINAIADDIVNVSEYFSYENKIRSNPNGAQRNAMTDKLLEKRPEVIGNINNIINTINSFDSETVEDDYEE